ncbi:MAG: sensor histidine kinase, partial [Burkholderiales bacterium]
IISVIIVATVMIATSTAMSSVYRQMVIERESEVMHDMVSAFTREEESEGELSSWDLKNYAESTARAHLEQGFNELMRLPGFAQVQVFDQDLTIVWSSRAELIGTRQTSHPEAAMRVIATNSPTAFNPALPDTGGDSLIEFYLPFRLGTGSETVMGVVSLYRSAGPIDAAVQKGVLLLWLLTGLGGIIMYVALYRLFLAVHHSRHEISSKLAKLSTEHERLIRIEKLSAMGQMVSEIAHQLNNPLVGVINLAELAEREIGNQTRVKELLGAVRSAGERCREYVQRVLRLSQLTGSERRLTDISQLARDTVAFFQQSLGGHPPVTLEAPVESTMCEVDPVLLRDALFNLIHNAAQADPNGSVVVSIAREQRDGMSAFKLTVSDHGPGFPPGGADQLFTPFFTTRPGGTGLGLSIAQHIAILHGGTISAENKPGGGARFTIWIPATQATA